MLRCIAYCSRMNSRPTDDELLEMVTGASARNERINVTGILFCMNDRYIQVLEGESEVVAALYEQIAADPRHHELITVMDDPLKARAFAGWSMRLVGEDDLSPGEQAIIIQALRSVEPPAPPAPRRPTLGALLSGPLGHVVSRAFRVPLRDTEAMETADRLLQAAQDLMTESHGDEAVTITLEQVVEASGVGKAAARRCVKDLDDLFHAGARRALAIEHLSFIDLMVEQTFESGVDIALAIVAFVLMSNAEREGLPAGVDRQILRQGFEVTCDSARIMADAIHDATPRPGWPCPALTPNEIAVALTATAAAARTLIVHDPSALGRPRNQDWLLRISLAGLGEPAA